jgi:cytochrome c oxidase subunit 2
MTGRVVAMEPAEYQFWLASSSRPEPVAASGRFAFEKLRCNTCHNAEAQRGPLLAGRFGHAVALRDGASATLDAAYIRESILNPSAKVAAGFQPIMPTYQGQISEEEILAIIDYLKAAVGSGPEGRQEVAPTVRSGFERTKALPMRSRGPPQRGA